MITRPAPDRTLDACAAALEAGRTSARALVEACLARIDDEGGEGARTFVHVDRAVALAAADATDGLRRAGAAPSRFAGIPISVKDLFDVRGQVTRAGSTVLADAPPALEDAVAVARLRRLGFVPIGRTNMTEFAYSGLGLNPHYGTPRNPWRRADGYVPGGSSSGAAISVSDGMAHAGLGSDTGGSCRIPAAFTGLVGYKPTARRVPLTGTVPLSTSLDSIGSIANSVACCAIIDAAMAGDDPTPLPVRPLRGLRLAVPTHVALDDLDDDIAEAFEAALARLRDAGVRIEHVPFPEFAGVAGLGAKGGLAAAESYAWHRWLLAERRADYDPRVAARIARGAEQDAADYLDLLAARRALMTRASARMAAYDGLLMPTVAIAPPRIADLADDEAFRATNLMALRNCTLVNVMDGCAVSLPMHRLGTAPAGLMLAGVGGADRAVLAIGAAVEAVLGDRS